jgi:Txe/YoeB family toxin of Txe-Axe toxin-antitoxin module
MTCSVYQLQFTKKAKKDIQSLSPKLKAKLKDILRYKIALKPESGKPLVGSLKGYYSVRLSYQDRVLYKIEKDRCMMCQHFYGHKIKLLLATFRNQQVTCNHSLNDVVYGYKKRRIIYGA